jgi:heat shock protein HslJ
MNRIPLRARTVVLLAALACASCTARSDANPSSPSAPLPLRGTEWTLVELEGKPLAAGGKAPTLTLAPDGSRAGGFAGCNQFFAAYTVSQENLQLTGIGMTRMFCEGRMDLEKAYTAALESARGYRINGSRLELLAGDKSIASFERR